MSGIAKRWAVRNVAKATFYDISTGKMLTYLENLKTSGIEVSSETVYARGGDGNPKLVGFTSDKEVKVNLSSAIFDNRAMALLTGNSIIEGATDVYKREVVVVGKTNEADLVGTPKEGKLLALYILGADGVEDTELEAAETVATGKYKLTTKKITVHTDITAGTKLVAYYMFATTTTAQTITVSANAFPATFKLVMEVLVTDFYTKKLYPAQIIVPSAKMEDNWSLSFEPTGDPQSLDLPVEILKPADSDDMFTMTIYEEPTTSS